MRGASQAMLYATGLTEEDMDNGSASDGASESGSERSSLSGGSEQFSAPSFLQLVATSSQISSVSKKKKRRLSASGNSRSDANTKQQQPSAVPTVAALKQSDSSKKAGENSNAKANKKQKGSHPSRTI